MLLVPAVGKASADHPPGLRLRAMVAEDLAFLRGLYGEGRRHERPIAGWPEAQWEGFLDSQFRLQQLHYARNHPDADRWLIERQALLSTSPIGRFDLDRDTPVWRVLELAVSAVHQGRGVGSACLRWLQDMAKQAGAAAIDLHVMHGNDGAMRFYQRHGFVEKDSPLATHRRMLWTIS